MTVLVAHSCSVHVRLSPSRATAAPAIIAMALEFDARLALVDGQFRAYSELADRLLA
jgi:hypothetical protein